jgi:hypothetical protein
MPSAFGIVRSGKVRVQAIASPLESGRFGKGVYRGSWSYWSMIISPGALRRGTPNDTRLEKQRVHMVAPISIISAVFISLPSLYLQALALAVAFSVGAWLLVEEKNRQISFESEFGKRERTKQVRRIGAHNRNRDIRVSTQDD